MGEVPDDHRGGHDDQDHADGEEHIAGMVDVGHISAGDQELAAVVVAHAQGIRVRAEDVRLVRQAVGLGNVGGGRAPGKGAKNEAGDESLSRSASHACSMAPWRRSGKL